MSTIKVTQVKSGVGRKQNQRETLRTLGLKRIGDSVVIEARPELVGMAKSISHLVTVEEVD